LPASGLPLVRTRSTASQLSRLVFTERGAIHGRRARVWLSKLSSDVGERELAVVRDELKWRSEECGLDFNSDFPTATVGEVV
jgi:RNA 3'-terminal phosphate cyclase